MEEQSSGSFVREAAAAVATSAETVTSTASSQQPRGLWSRIKKYVVDPRRIFHRYSLLCLICMFIPGPYFHDSMLATCKGHITTSMSLSSTQFGLLFAISSLTGVACGPAGALMANWGRTRMALGSGFICSMGALGTVMGYRHNLYGIMLVARFFFWLALYGLLMVQTVLVYSVFSGELMVLAYSLTVFAMRVGALSAYFLSATLIAQYGPQGALWCSVLFVFIAFGATILFAILFRGTTTAQTIRPLLNEQRAQKSFDIGLISKVPRSLVALLGANGCLFAVVFPFEAVAVDMFQKRFGYNAYNAGVVLSLIPALSLPAPLLTPFLGKSVAGKLCNCVVGFLLLLSGHTLLSMPVSWAPVPGMCAIGIGYVISVCCIYTVIPSLINSCVPADIATHMEQLATGLSYLALAVTQFVSNLAAGVLKDTFLSYRYVSVWFACLSALGAILILASLVSVRPLVQSEGHQPTNLPPEGGEGQVVVFDEQRHTGPQHVECDGSSRRPGALQLAVHENHC